LDYLKLLKDEITGDAEDVSVKSIMEKLKAFQDTSPDEKSETESEKGITGQAEEVELIDNVIIDIVKEAELRGYQAYLVKVNVDQSCQMKNVRAFLVFDGLQRGGDIIKSSPAAEDIQDGKYDNSFTLVYITQDSIEQVKNTVMSISEIDSVEIQVIDTNDLNLSPAQIEASDRDEKESDLPPITSSAAPSNSMERTTIKTVRVDVQKLDTLMNLVSELVIDRTRLVRFVDIFENKYGSEDLVENIMEISNHLGQVTTDLQEEIMKARMLPVATVFNRMPRMVRDIAQKLGKEIDFIIEGQETELDRNVIEIIGDPLIHLIRNAIDHGIESPNE
ncbi:MAG: chemotaxis protein CheA, partial [Bacillota bacterium]